MLNDLMSVDLLITYGSRKKKRAKDRNECAIIAYFCISNELVSHQMNNKKEYVECHFVNSFFAADRIIVVIIVVDEVVIQFSFTWTRYKLAMTAKMNRAKINRVKT